MQDYLRTLAVQQIQSLPNDVRLVVINPNYVQQHIILSHLLPQMSLYLRFRGDALTQDMLSQQLATTLSEQADNANLAEMSVIVLDECDRANDDIFSEFLVGLLAKAPKAQIFMLSRRIPAAITMDSELHQASAFIPHDKRYMLWDYADITEETKLLEVRSFGEGRAILNGKLITNWDGVLPRSLFFFLVDKGMTTRNEIFETFWPTLTTREATNVFHVTKRKISEVLGIDLTTYWSGFYRISPDIELSYDVVSFTKMAQDSAVMDDPGEASALLESALTLYRGSFLHNMDMNWAVQRRKELAMDYSDALSNLAEIRERQGNMHEALGLYLRAAANSQNREDVAVRIMQLYRQLDMHADAITVYEQLADSMQTNLSIAPGMPLQELAQTIKQEMSQPAV